ncbi:hypothetical protein HaLaN_10418, partial [Haematococcus lacustris]
MKAQGLDALEKTVGAVFIAGVTVAEVRERLLARATQNGDPPQQQPSANPTSNHQHPPTISYATYAAEFYNGANAWFGTAEVDGHHVALTSSNDAKTHTTVDAVGTHLRAPSQRPWLPPPLLPTHPHPMKYAPLQSHENARPTAELVNLLPRAALMDFLGHAESAAFTGLQHYDALQHHHALQQPSSWAASPAAHVPHGPAEARRHGSPTCDLMFGHAKELYSLINHPTATCASASTSSQPVLVPHAATATGTLGRAASLAMTVREKASVAKATIRQPHQQSSAPPHHFLCNLCRGVLQWRQRLVWYCRGASCDIACKPCLDMGNRRSAADEVNSADIVPMLLLWSQVDGHHVALTSSNDAKTHTTVDAVGTHLRAPSQRPWLPPPLLPTHPHPMKYAPLQSHENARPTAEPVNLLPRAVLMDFLGHAESAVFTGLQHYDPLQHHHALQQPSSWAASPAAHVPHGPAEARRHGSPTCDLMFGHAKELYSLINHPTATCASASTSSQPVLVPHAATATGTLGRAASLAMTVRDKASVAKGASPAAPLWERGDTTPAVKASMPTATPSRPQQRVNTADAAPPVPGSSA